MAAFPNSSPSQNVIVLQFFVSRFFDYLSSYLLNFIELLVIHLEVTAACILLG
jgi:hypothetical protein